MRRRAAGRGAGGNCRAAAGARRPACARASRGGRRRLPEAQLRRRLRPRACVAPGVCGCHAPGRRLVHRPPLPAPPGTPAPARPFATKCETRQADPGALDVPRASPGRLGLPVDCTPPGGADCCVPECAAGCKAPHGRCVPPACARDPGWRGPSCSCRRGAPSCSATARATARARRLPASAGGGGREGEQGVPGHRRRAVRRRGHGVASAGTAGAPPTGRAGVDEVACPDGCRPTARASPARATATGANCASAAAPTAARPRRVRRHRRGTRATATPAGRASTAAQDARRLPGGYYYNGTCSASPVARRRVRED